MRCGVYARVSTEFDEQRTSIDNQISIFENYVAQKGWDIAKVYTDKKSGTKQDRSGLQQLIQDVKDRVIDVVLAKELSRIARNGRLSYEFFDVCNLNNVHIICLDNSVNTFEGNYQNFGLFAWLYETESTNSSRRNKQAKDVKARRGRFIGSNPPYGYHCEDGVLYIREDETPDVIKEIFNEYIGGKGMTTIAKELTVNRVPTPAQVAGKSNASAEWHTSTVRNILTNPHYCGDLVQKRTEMISVTSIKRKEVEDTVVRENTHEAIIPKETFQTVQNLIGSKTRTTSAPKKHLFTNLLYCEDCQKALWYKASKNSIYRCGGNLRFGEHFCLNQFKVKEKELSMAVIEDLQNLFNAFTKDNVVDQLLTNLGSRKHVIVKQIQQVEADIEVVKEQKLKYVNLFTEDIISKEELSDYRKQADNKIQKLEADKETLLQKKQHCEDENYIIQLREKLKDVLDLKQLTPHLLHSLVERITCTKDGDVKIQYRFVNPLAEA